MSRLVVAHLLINWRIWKTNGMWIVIFRQGLFEIIHFYPKKCQEHLHLLSWYTRRSSGIHGIFRGALLHRELLWWRVEMSNKSIRITSSRVKPDWFHRRGKWTLPIDAHSLHHHLILKQRSEYSLLHLQDRVAYHHHLDKDVQIHLLDSHTQQWPIIWKRNQLNRFQVVRM